MVGGVLVGHHLPQAAGGGGGVVCVRCIVAFIRAEE